MEVLRNKTFMLIENNDGLAKADTVMTFDNSSNSQIATYSGPNVISGHAIVHNGIMLYHALDANGQLCAGTATVSLLSSAGASAVEMVLNWQWLSGDKTKGVSRWRAVKSE